MRVCFKHPTSHKAKHARIAPGLNQNLKQKCCEAIGMRQAPSPRVPGKGATAALSGIFTGLKRERSRIRPLSRPFREREGREPGACQLPHSISA